MTMNKISRKTVEKNAVRHMGGSGYLQFLPEDSVTEFATAEAAVQEFLTCELQEDENVILYGHNSESLALRNASGIYRY
jgi:hypothetical protein